ncbi:MAG TPA: bile acid:sodium symporter [Gemmatales bacterium]|nr:bile acid:sodium symporter [Gemmatales bacterium]
MLKSVLDIAVPCLTFLMMMVVGLELTVDDFRRAARQRRVVILATLIQIIVWPLVAVAVITIFPLKPYIATGLLLVAICPSGTMANVYTYFGRGNVAFSVTLTAISCLAAVITIPAWLWVLQPMFDNPDSFQVPILVILGQLLLLLMLPIFIGMTIRRRLPGLTQRYGRILLLVSILSLAFLIGFVVAQEWEHLLADYTQIALVVVALTVIMLLLGWVSGKLFGLTLRDQFANSMVLVVRNVGIATAVAVSVLGRTEFAAFASAYFLSQIPVVALVIFAVNRSGGFQPLLQQVTTSS